MNLDRTERNISIAVIVVVILMAIGACRVMAQTGIPITVNTLFEWDPVLTTTDGEPVLCSYELAAFWPSNTVPQFAVPVTTNVTFTALGPMVKNMIPFKPYELRVRAIVPALNVISAWSTPLIIERQPGLGPPQNLRIK